MNKETIICKKCRWVGIPKEEARISKSIWFCPNCHTELASQRSLSSCLACFGTDKIYTENAEVIQ